MPGPTGEGDEETQFPETPLQDRLSESRRMPPRTVTLFVISPSELAD